jgi:sugar phosphate permease
MAAMAVDISGRRMSGTASGLLDAHGYLYSGTMAIVFSVLLDMGGSPWPIIFLFMAGTRILAAGMIARVRV